MELTLSQRAGLANSQSFKNKLEAAAIKKANYWKGQAVNSVPGFNLEMQKRKRFAQAILETANALDRHMESYVNFFVSNYNEDIDVAGQLEDDEDEFNAETNQLHDLRLTDSGAADLTYDFFAGVLAGDNTRPIIW